MVRVTLKCTFITASLITLILFTRSLEAKVINEHIYLVPAGGVDQKTLEAIKEKLPESLPMSAKAETSLQVKMPESAYDASRGQYNAEIVLDDISQRLVLDTRNENALIITDVDLYAPGLNFVFGLVNTPKKTCVISLARLKNEFYGLKPDSRLFLERALKEAVHELGHVWGLEHCLNPRCVMYFSNSLPDTDRKRAVFCVECRKKLNNRYERPLLKRPIY